MSDSNQRSWAPIILVVLAIVMGLGWYIWTGQQKAAEEREGARAAQNATRGSPTGEPSGATDQAQPTGNPDTAGTPSASMMSASRMTRAVQPDAGVTMEPRQATKIVQTPAGPLELTLDGRIPGMMPAPRPIVGVVVEPDNEPGISNPTPAMQQFTGAMNNLLSQSGGVMVDCLQVLRPSSVRDRQAVTILTTIGPEGQLNGMRIADEATDAAQLEACFREGLGDLQFVRPPNGEEITIERVIQMGAPEE